MRAQLDNRYVRINGQSAMLSFGEIEEGTFRSLRPCCT